MKLENYALAYLLFLCVSVKPIRQNEKSRCPNSNENTEAFGMGLALGISTPSQIPDSNGANDRCETEEETNVT